MRSPLRSARRPCGRPACHLLALVAVLLAACTRDAPPRAAESVAVAPPPVRPESTPPRPPSRRPAWDVASAGPALFVPTDTARPAFAAAVLPTAEVDPADTTADSSADTTAATAAAAALRAAVDSLAGVSVELFAPTGQVGSTTVAVDASAPIDDECAPGPAVQLRQPPGRGVWTVAFAAGRARPLPADSLQGLASVDSAARTAEVARLASLARGTNSREFSGLPFAVRQARHFAMPDGRDVLVAEAVRKIAQEANPREQHVLIVAERAKGAKKYELAYQETSVGEEDAVETRDMLAAVLLGSARRPTVVLNRESGDGLAYSLVERLGANRWRTRWTSTRTGCEPET